MPSSQEYSSRSTPFVKLTQCAKPQLQATVCKPQLQAIFASHSCSVINSYQPLQIARCHGNIWKLYCPAIDESSYTPPIFEIPPWWNRDGEMATGISPHTNADSKNRDTILWSFRSPFGDNQEITRRIMESTWNHPLYLNLNIIANWFSKIIGCTQCDPIDLEKDAIFGRCKAIKAMSSDV